MDSKESPPFICIEVSEASNLVNLSKRFDELFPNDIIRLVINKEYSPYFYLGNGKWHYKPKYKRKNQKATFKMKLFVEDSIYNFFLEDQIILFDWLNIPINEMLFATDIETPTQKISGILFTNGEYFIIDQYMCADVQTLVEFLIPLLRCEVIIDLLNDNQNGIIILKAKENILGDNNDKSNS